MLIMVANTKDKCLRDYIVTCNESSYGEIAKIFQTLSELMIWSSAVLTEPPINLFHIILVPKINKKSDILFFKQLFSLLPCVNNINQLYPESILIDRKFCKNHFE
jgi:hypothetical protein